MNDKEWIMYKSRWGAFFKTKFNSFLRKQKINTLTVVGCNFPNCPRTSIYEASERDYKIILIEDAISGLYPKGVKEMENIGVCIMNTADVINAIKI